MEIVTSAYSNSAAECGRKAAIDFLEKWWWAFALPILCALVASLWNCRWLVAGMALALVAYPFVLMMAYYTRALTPEAAKSMLSKHARISDDGIEIIYEPFDDNAKAPDKEYFPFCGLKRIEDRGDSLALQFPDRELVIPISAIDSNEMDELMSFFSSKGIALA